MSNDELKDALFGGLPVMYKNAAYRRVSGIIYRVVDGKLRVQAELLDQCGHAITIADPAQVELKNEVKRTHETESHRAPLCKEQSNQCD
ncbi:MAG: hypothetical protein ABF449_00680 [Ethanoligenens sp.]